MIKVKTSDLIGMQLDWSVAVAAQGNPYQIDIFAPSSDWMFGGPIIEREHICLRPRSHYVPNETEGVWDATIYFNAGEQDTKSGPTPLIAAMRAFVASKLGDEVEVPA